MDHPEMKNTVFGEVLAELLEARGLPATPFTVGKLAEDAGLDGWRVINRMVSTGVEYAGPFDGLARALDLSVPEMMDLAHAFAFAFDERRMTQETRGGEEAVTPYPDVERKPCERCDGPGAMARNPPSSTGCSTTGCAGGTRASGSCSTRRANGRTRCSS